MGYGKRRNGGGWKNIPTVSTAIGKSVGKTIVIINELGEFELVASSVSRVGIKVKNFRGITINEVIYNFKIHDQIEPYPSAL